MALRTGGAGAHRYGLIALGIDSHAETRAARADADAYLSDLVLELRTDSAGLETRSEGLAGLSASATALLEVLEAGGVGNADVGALLMGSVSGDAVTSEPVVWEELQSTEILRLIEDTDKRSAIVGHYLERSSRFRTIDDNYGPALRALRAVAWDIMPIDAFGDYVRTGSPGVPSATVLDALKQRRDAEFPAEANHHDIKGSQDQRPGRRREYRFATEAVVGGVVVGAPRRIGQSPNPRTGSLRQSIDPPTEGPEGMSCNGLMGSRPERSVGPRSGRALGGTQPMVFAVKAPRARAGRPAFSDDGPGSPNQ